MTRDTVLGLLGAVLARDRQAEFVCTRAERLSRRSARVSFPACLVVICLLTGCSRVPRDSPDDPRFVLLLTIDTLRSDYLGAGGYDRPTTPFLDSLLAHGVFFPNTLAPAPRTTQSLASLLTGGYPHTTGLRTLFDRLSPRVGTLAELFRSRGFHTVAVVSNHVLSRKRGLDRGFDVYEVSNTLRPARETREAVVRILSTTPMRRPLFLWVHYVDPHMPYVPEPATAQLLDPGYTGRYARGFGSLEIGEGRHAFPADLPKPLAVYRNPLSEAVRAHIRRLYAAEIRQADDQIARMVAAIKQRFGKDGWIVFTADHGESLGEHDFYYDHGDYVYTPSLRVPLGFYAPREPRVAQGRVVPVWVSLVDVVPTLIELAALNLPKAQSGQVEGHSLVPWFGESKSSPHPVFAESGKSYFPHELRRRVHFDVAGRFRSVVDGSWQLIWTPGLAPKHRYELYDLDRDPYGERDLYMPGNPRAARLAQQLHHWYRPLDSDESVPEADDLRMLRGLGYIE